ncbi:MAG: hypothetical protein WCQ99_02730 [Pseudomonadota bacterium]
MKKRIYRVTVMAVLFGLLFGLGTMKEVTAQVQVNIDIAAPPPLQFSEPPDVYVVPSGASYVYMMPNYEGVYFFGGSWYRFYNDRWFRSSHYNGDWGYIEQSFVPQVIIVLPPEYINYVPSGYYRIHYDDFYSNWETWDHKRHWDRYDWYKHERSDDIRRERYSRIENDRLQRRVRTPQHQQEQGRRQQDIQTPRQHDEPKPQQREEQKPQRRQQDIQTPRQHDEPKPQQREEQKPQRERGEKEHGERK